MRFILAATLSANYGIYGPAFERFVHVAAGARAARSISTPRNTRSSTGSRSDDDLTELMALVNRIRRENPALQQNATLTFHDDRQREHPLLQQDRRRRR